MRNEKQKNKFSLKAVAVCFVAFAIIFLPTTVFAAPDASCTCSSGATICAPGDPPTPPCGSGETCILNSGTGKWTCQAISMFSGGTPTTIDFPSPTGATSFSAIMCAVITFFSQTILPPIAVLMMLVVGFLFMVGGQMPQKAIAARKTLLYVVAGVILLLLAPGILAIIADITESAPIIGSCPSIPMTMDSIVKTIANLINWFAWFVSITSVVMGLYAGALYLTARGDSSQVLKATKVFSYTIIGIAVAVVSFSIILLTRTFFGL